MTDESVIEFYKKLGFEEIEIEDRLTALYFESEPATNYAIVTNDDGLLPTTLREPLVFACYTPEGSFLWSISFKNSFLFKDLWTETEIPAEKIEAIYTYRATIEYYQ